MKNLWKVTLWALALLSVLFVLWGCGDDEPEETPGGEHTCAGVSWVTEKEATCTVEGSKKFVCSCGKTVKTEKIPLLSHTEVTVPGRASTCTQKGLTDGKKCSVCQTVTVAQQELALASHTEEVIPGRASTCMQKGLTDGKRCSVCGETLVAQTEIPLASHTAVTIPGRAATCTEKGLTDLKKCSVCESELSDQQVISALGHSFVSGVCIRCGIPSASDLNCMIFHFGWIPNYSDDKFFTTYEDFAAYVAENTFSHADELAKYDREYFETHTLVVAIEECSYGGLSFRASGTIEGKTYNLNVESYQPSGDDFVWAGTPAFQTYWVAVELPKDALAGMDLLAVYHHESLVSEFDLSGACKHLNVYTEIVAPTCVADGAEKHICLDCKEIITMTPILATGHTFGDWQTIAPNGCASAEYAVRVCTKCFFLEYNIDPSLDVHPHDFELTLVEASCTESGRATVTCKNCGIVGADEYLSPLGHDLNWVFTAETHGKECARPGCDYAIAAESHTADGNTSPCVDTRCTVCGYILSEGLGHEFSSDYESDASGHWHACTREGCDWIHSYGTHRNPDATCKDASAVCTVCGIDFVPSGAHVYGEWQTLRTPTCTESGTLRRVCNYCSHYILETVPPTGHDMGAWYTVEAPTESANGMRQRDCNVCDYYETETIPATGHVFGAWHTVTAPTCTEAGAMQRECRDCGYVQTVSLSALGHSVNVWYFIEAPTCTAAGSSYGYCTRCGERITRSNGALGHDFGDYTGNGTYHWRACLRCDAKTSKVAHSGGSATCTERARCSVCNLPYGREPSGHRFSTSYSHGATTHYYSCLNGCGAKQSEAAHNMIAKTSSVRAEDTGTQIRYIHTLYTECSVCAYKETVRTVVGSEHYGVTIMNAVAPTCTEPGLTWGWKCAVAGCNEIYVAQETVPALGHNYVGGVCTRCGDGGNSGENPGGGNPGEGPGIEVHTCVGVRWDVTRAATCRQTGIKALICSCGRTLRTETIPLAAHTEQTIPGRAATCEQTGLTDGKKCSVCGATLVAQTEIPLAPHTYDDAYDATCNVCGFVRNVACRHSSQITVPGYAATCTQAGLTDGRKCSSCGATLVAQTEIPIDPDAHNVVNGTCTLCGYSSGTEIRTVADLRNIASNLNANYILMNDLDLGGMEWTPIGTDDNNSFTGTFDGNGHVIKNFKITGDVRYAGLFGYSKGTIQNIGLENFTIDVSYSGSSYVYAGGLVGYNYGSTSASGTITNCYATGDVSVSSTNSPVYAGGLVGENYYSATITNCYATGDVSASNTSYSAYAGGLVGRNYYSAITNSYATGAVSATASGNYAYAGGLVGYNESSATITNSYATGDVSARGKYAYAGGLVGRNFGTITNSYATGAVSASSTSSDAYAGGLVGRNNGTITNCYRYSGQSFTVTKNGTTTYEATNTIGTEASIENLQSKAWVEANLWKTEIEIWSFDAGYPALNYEVIDGLVIEIATKEEIMALQGCVLVRNYKLMADIDLGGMEWQPIAIFFGTFDGNGHVIENFKITGDVKYAGLFGYSKGVIQNLGIENFTIDVSHSGSAYAGGLVGYNDDGTITNSYATGDVSARSTGNYNAYAGGLVGCNDSGNATTNTNITNCYATGDVSARSTGNYNAYAGGLVGCNGSSNATTNTNITNCYATGAVSASSTSGNAYAGGLVGYNSGTITNSYATGAVSASSTYDCAYAGGLVGCNGSSNATTNTNITNCYATGVVSATARGTDSDATAGGLVGRNYNGTITNSYATGDVSATTSSTGTSSDARAYASGLVGTNSGTITHCYATGDVSATASGNYASAYAGGLVGTNSGTITHCYATGDVSVSGTSKSSSAYAYAGGLVGGSYGPITHCYATGDVSATASSTGTDSNVYSYAGGLVGYNSGTITNSYAMGAVSVSASSTSGSYYPYAYAGGLVGYNVGSNASITNCYATGDVSASGKHAYAGGLVGRNSGTIMNSYATGAVSATGSSVDAGGLVGRNDEGTITNCYRYSSQSFTVTVNGTTTYEATNTDGTEASIGNLQSKAWVEANLWKAEIEIWSFGAGYPTLDYEVIDALMQSEIEISTKEEIIALQGCGLIGNYKLMADIDLGGMEWQPIAIFVGTFDGNGHVIENFKITGDVQYAGLFGYSKGAIQNLGIENFTIDVSYSGTIYAGGLVGYNDDGTITNCYATGDVSATASSRYAVAYAGGLVGYNIGSTSASAIITNCYATGEVSATGSSAYAGGLVGYNIGSTSASAIITNCYATGDVSATASSNYAFAGGLVGMYYNGTITNSYAAGDVSVSSTNSRVYAGGLVGYNSSGTITNCYRYSGQSFTVTVNGTTTYSATNEEGTAKDMATLQSVNFQQNTLLWSAEDWSFAAGAHPTLKNVGIAN